MVKKEVLAILTFCSTGSLGGIVEACCCQPIDVIKTRLQLDHHHKYSGNHCVCLSAHSLPWLFPESYRQDAKKASGIQGALGINHEHDFKCTICIISTRFPFV